jgi:hypothetical protein
MVHHDAIGGPVTLDTSSAAMEGQVDGDVSGGNGVEGAPVETLQRITNGLGRIAPLVQLEERTGIGRLYLAVIIAAVSCLLFVTIFGVAFFRYICILPR